MYIVMLSLSFFDISIDSRLSNFTNSSNFNSSNFRLRNLQHPPSHDVEDVDIRRLGKLAEMMERLDAKSEKFEKYRLVKRRWEKMVDLLDTQLKRWGVGGRLASQT